MTSVQTHQQVVTAEAEQLHDAHKLADALRVQVHDEANERISNDVQSRGADAPADEAPGTAAWSALPTSS
ncbi:MAG TPA: hypothetical protein VK899_06590 [Gemmatimonadales bacterium]|nr:hypothetical protein [Gemmatimonadales bacterium]